MEKESYPSLGETIKYVRRLRGFSQEELAFWAGISQDTISRLEKGRHDPTNDTIHALRIKLNIEWLPLAPHERHRYRERLQEWLVAMEEENTELADAMQQKLSQIAILPHEGELAVSYEVFELRWHLFKGNRLDINKSLERLGGKQDTLTEVQKYYFYYNWGIFYTRKKKFKLALESYLEAYQWSKFGMVSHAKLYFNIALCYWELGFGGRAVTFLNKLRKKYPIESLGTWGQRVENLLITCHIATGRYDSAKEMLDKCMTGVKQVPISDKEMCRILLRYGHLYRNTKQYELAIEYLDKALPYCKMDKELHMEVLYQKIWCLLGLGRPVGCIEFLNEGKKIAERSGNLEWGQEYLICFRALEAISLVESASSRDYLENVAFPYLLERGSNYVVMDFYKCLIAYYEKRGIAMTKMLEMMKTIYHLQNEMLEGGALD